MNARSVRAVVLDGPGALREVVLELDEPKENEVEVEIAAAGVCGSDLHVYRGEWVVNYPMVMGHEGSGRISKVGEGVTDLAVGDHVVLSWNPPCRTCRNCVLGRTYACEQATDLIDGRGVLFDGTTRFHDSGRPVHHYLGVSSWAEFVVVPATGAIRIPRQDDLTAFALAGCALPTGIGSVCNTAGLERGAQVLVIGCGGVGLSCVLGARIQGARKIVAVDIDPNRTALAARLGATDVLVVPPDSTHASLSHRFPQGFDAVFDAVGSVSTVALGLELLGLAGSLVIVGLSPAGSRVSIDPLNLAMRNQRILGSNYGSIDPSVDIPAIVAMIENGTIEVEPLISSRRRLFEAELALDDLARGRALRQLLVP